jgi:two-component system sensor histidine kinase YesM
MNLVYNDASKIAGILETYRHKAYQLSTNPLVVQIMQQDVLLPNSDESRDLYQLLFSTMKGDTYLASANLVSDSGKVRVSTHTFPDVYDLRYHGNAWEMNSIISQPLNASPTASIISIRGHRLAENGRQVIASILRHIYDDAGTNLGYLVIDIYADALASQVNTERLLSDVLLFETNSFYATSLVHTEQFGTFDKFPIIADLKGDYTSRTLQTPTAVASITPIPGTGLHIAGTIISAPFEASLDRWLYAFSITMVIGIILAMVLSFLFSRSIVRPIRNLASRMAEVEEGSLEAKETKSDIREFTQLEHSFNVMVRQIVSLLDLTREEQEKVSEAERKALESQMNPHFLFNTLNTIKALARLHGETDIYTITVKLGKLLRSSIDNHESECTLAESMALIDSYLTIQKLRFGDKLKATTFLDPSCSLVKTPKLIIQPLVENSIIHGLEPKTGEWILDVRVEKKQGRICITIRDNGIGFAEGTLPENLDELANSTHVGVYNVYRRLVLNYGRGMNCLLSAKPGEGTQVLISFPDDLGEKGSDR